jgi:hypothetical protein
MPAREITFEVDNIIIPIQSKVSNNTVIEIEENPSTLAVTTNVPLRPPLVLRPAGRINLITEDGSQYDDDNLQMFQRAGIIIRDKNVEGGTSTQSETDDIGEARLETTDENGNVISEPILDLTNPNIKQLIVIYPTYQDKTLNRNRLLLTGKSFYQKLENDFKNNNVYAINAAFDERFTIKIVLSDMLEVIQRNTLAEQGLDIEMYRNLAFLDTGEIDYDLLISYIDWLISKPNYLEFVDNNVVPIEYIADYSIKGRPSVDSELEGQPQTTPEVIDNTTPAVVPFTPENINTYQNLNTSSTFDRRLATQARRVTPDGTGKNIVDGTYLCFAPGNQSRRNAIIKVYEDLERLRTRITNTNNSERKQEARRDLREKDDERAILVAQHYMICETFLQELQNRPGNTPGSSATITTAPNTQQSRGTM